MRAERLKWVQQGGDAPKTMVAVGRKFIGQRQRLRRFLRHGQILCLAYFGEKLGSAIIQININLSS